MIEWQVISLTLKLATITMLCLLVLSTPIAWWLSQTRHWSRHVVSAVTTLPLVLPPTVLGFYLLLFLGANGPGGLLADSLGLAPLVFSFPGLVIGSIVYSLPFAVQPLVNAFKSIDTRVLEVAATSGAGAWDRFVTIVLPLARPGFLSAGVLSFAHTLGEFGVILMIGGNIPGETRVLSIAIYDHVEALEYAQAHWLSGGMLLFGLLVLIAVNQLNQSSARKGLSS